MNVLRVVVVIATATVVHAEDFTLKHFAFGNVIALHTTLSLEGKGARLIATAKNESGVQVVHAKICILSAALQTGCLFELWNTEQWAPGEELTWNVTTPIKLSGLAHNASLLEFEEVAASAQSASQRQALKVSPIQNTTPSDQSKPETLTNETIVQLSKVGLGDEVIISMIASQPGSYSQTSSEIIKMKEAGVSDKVIAAVLSYKVASPLNVPGRDPLHIEENSRLFISPMESNLNEFISAEIVKQKLPLVLVLAERDADYILTGLSQQTEVKWYDVISGSLVGGKDRLEASAKLVRVKDKTFVWAGESGDRSLIFGGLKRGGQRKLAERIVKKMKEDLF